MIALETALGYAVPVAPSRFFLVGWFFEGGYREHESMFFKLGI